MTEWNGEGGPIVVEDYILKIEEVLEPTDVFFDFEKYFDENLMVVDYFDPPNWLAFNELLRVSDSFVTPKFKEFLDSLTVSDSITPFTFFFGVDFMVIDLFNSNAIIDVYDNYWRLKGVDLGIPGRKTIRSIAFGINGDASFDVDVYVYYNNSLSERKIIGRTTRVDNVAFVNVTGHTFDIVLKKDIGSNITFDELSYVIIEYQLDDKRFRRSAYAF